MRSWNDQPRYLTKQAREHRDKETEMTDQTQTQQSIPIPPLAVRLTEKDGWWGKIVLAAAKFAVARRNGKDAPADQGRLIAEGVQKVKTGNRYPMFFGDMVALGLSGLIKHPDPAGRDAIRQIEEALNELKKRHGDKPPHAYPPKDAIAFYELITRLDAGIDAIDNSPSCTAIILDRKAGNRVRAFAILRRAVGITRSGHYREGDKLKQYDDFTRINQDGMRALLQMYGEHMHAQGKPVISAPTEVVISNEEDQFIGDLARSAAEEKARRSETDEEWAYKTCSLWLAGKEPDDDEGPTGENERINALKDEVKNLTDSVNILKAQVEATADPDMKSAGQTKLTRLRNDLQTKTDELTALEKPATNGAKANGSTAPRPGDGAPMPTTARITVATETGEKSVEEAIAEVQKQIEDQTEAAAIYREHAKLLRADARGLMANDETIDLATDKLNEARIADNAVVSAKKQIENRKTRLAELEELKAKGVQPAAEPGKDQQPPKPKKVRLSGRKASAATRATAGETQQSTAAGATEETAEQRAERERLATLAATQPAVEPVVAAPGAVTQDGGPEAENPKAMIAREIARHAKEGNTAMVIALTETLKALGG